MQDGNLNQRINLISTLWSLVLRAHRGPEEEMRSAREHLLARYGGAALRYLRGVLHDRGAADEVFQDFALHLLHGDLRGADPQRGRFRDFVKGTLLHLIADYRKREQRWPGPLPADGAALADDSERVASDRRFVESWRDELLARAWAGLAAVEARTGQPYHIVLRLRADHPELRSPQMAERLAGRLGRPFTAAGVRQALHRARERFAELLLGEVAHSLDNPTAEELEQELAELGLLDYCRPALGRQGLTV